MDHGEIVYLGIGGNFSKTEEAIGQALEKLAKHPKIWELRSSSLCKNPAVSPIPQADYLNMACELKTSLSPHELLRYAESIERDLGQRRKAKDAPRLIDIDIILFGTQRINDARLEVPHPRWQERPFVIEPLSELVDSVALPRQGDPERCDTIQLTELLFASSH